MTTLTSKLGKELAGDFQSSDFRAAAKWAGLYAKRLYTAANEAAQPERDVLIADANIYQSLAQALAPFNLGD